MDEASGETEVEGHRLLSLVDEVIVRKLVTQTQHNENRAIVGAACINKPVQVDLHNTKRDIRKAAKLIVARIVSKRNHPQPVSVVE